MTHTPLAPIDWAICVVYFAFVLGIGVVLKRYTKTSTDFFLAGRALPAWVCGLAFISANLGAQEVIGMAASGAKYGIATCHFYWVGAIPAMVFVGIFMMPFYYGSRARSVPEYLRLRFDEKTRAVNAIAFAVMTVFSSGISMYALAKLMQALHIFDAVLVSLSVPRDWGFHVSIAVSVVIVFAYIFLGGLTSAIYNEVLQFFLIVAGFLPLTWIGLTAVGGWSGLQARLAPLSSTYTHAWAGMADPQGNLLGVEWFGMVMGLGFVLSFGYWCTDFLVVQRAMAANSMAAARRTPLIAALPKMVMPALVILPGLVAMALSSPDPAARARGDARIVGAGGQEDSPCTAIIPIKCDGDGRPIVDAGGRPQRDYDLAIPNMLMRFFPPGLLGLGLTALMASFMSGMAGNVTAFNTVWTYDIYQSYIRPDADDAHYLAIGRMATVWGLALSVAAAYAATRFNNLMDLLQLVFAFVNAPVFATFLLGMFWRRATGHGAFSGLVAGTLAAALHHGLTLPLGAVAGIKGGWIAVLSTYTSEMGQNFWTAIVAWTTCFVVTIGVSLVTAPRPDAELTGLVWSLTPRPKGDAASAGIRPETLGAIVLAAALILNFLFR